MSTTTDWSCEGQQNCNYASNEHASFRKDAHHSYTRIFSISGRSLVCHQPADVFQGFTQPCRYDTSLSGVLLTTPLLSRWTLGRHLFPSIARLFLKWCATFSYSLKLPTMPVRNADGWSHRSRGLTTPKTKSTPMMTFPLDGKSRVRPCACYITC